MIIYYSSDCRGRQSNPEVILFFSNIMLSYMEQYETQKRVSQRFLAVVQSRKRKK